MISVYCYELKMLAKRCFLYILLQLNPSVPQGKDATATAKALAWRSGRRPIYLLQKAITIK